MTDKTVAYTKMNSPYPGYVNVSPSADGGVIIHLRGDPTSRKGVYVCRYSSDKYVHGTCTPSDDNCNNYCNMAPQKGPMQKSAKECEMIEAGSCASLTLSAEEWGRLKQEFTS